LDAYAAKAGLGPNPRDLQKPWTQEVQAHLGNCGIEVPAETVMITGSRKGTHTEHLGYILSVMQILPRMYPNAKW
jgi:ring-1,2-phenylacetyl-CoA epoxidase subunit PaaC